MDDAGAGTAPAPSRQLKPFFRWLDECRALYLRELLTETHGNVTRAVSVSGIGHAMFYRLAKRLHVNPADFRPKWSGWR